MHRSGCSIFCTVLGIPVALLYISYSFKCVWFCHISALGLVWYRYGCCVDYDY